MVNLLNQNSEFLFCFQGTMTNCNGDPDQENKPRMDYETSTLLVSDARRKRDCRDFLHQKGYTIFVNTLDDEKVPMDKMFEYIRDKWLADDEKIKKIFNENLALKEKWYFLFGAEKKEATGTFKEAYQKMKKDKKINKLPEFTKFNNLFLTEIIKRELIDIRLFGSAMAVEKVSRTFTGPVQITWGYSLHPVELVKSNTIISIMNEGSSTFGKKHKVYYAHVAHYGTINKYSAKLTGMTSEDRDIFRKTLVQGMMNNQTDSKQGQEPLLYLEIIYNSEFDGYLGDLRRFLNISWEGKKPIRRLEDLAVDFGRLAKTIAEMKRMGYVEKVIGWQHPFVNEKHLVNIPPYEKVDLWTAIKLNEVE